MLKKIITTLMLILFIASSSGVVIFAFECTEFKHFHISIFNKITCADFEEEIAEHINHNGHNCCGCHNKETIVQHNDNTINAIQKCGFQHIKVLSLGIVIDIAKKNIKNTTISYYNIYPDLLARQKDFIIHSLQNANIKKPSTFIDISLLIVQYIRTITSIDINS